MQVRLKEAYEEIGVLLAGDKASSVIVGNRDRQKLSLLYLLLLNYMLYWRAKYSIYSKVNPIEEIDTKEPVEIEVISNNLSSWTD